MDWDKSQIKLAVVSGVVGALAMGAIQFLSFGATSGRLTASVDGLKERVAKLESRGTPGTKLADLCLKLMDAQNIAYRSSDRETRQEIDAQLQRLGCYENVPAAAEVDTTDDPNWSNATGQSNQL